MDDINAVGTPELADNAVTAAKVAFNYAASATRAARRRTWRAVAAWLRTAVGTNAGRDTVAQHLRRRGRGCTATDANTMRLGLPFNTAPGAGQTKTFVAGIAGTVLTTPPAAPRADAALLQRLAAQDAVIAGLRARLARLEAQLAARPGRR
jgi:hypothetical protein